MAGVDKGMLTSEETKAENENNTHRKQLNPTQQARPCMEGKGNPEPLEKRKKKKKTKRTMRREAASSENQTMQIDSSSGHISFEVESNNHIDSFSAGELNNKQAAHWGLELCLTRWKTMTT